MIHLGHTWTAAGYTNAVTGVTIRTGPVSLTKKFPGQIDVIYSHGFRKPPVPTFTTDKENNHG